MVTLSFNASYHWCRMHVLRKAYFTPFRETFYGSDGLHDPGEKPEAFVRTDIDYFLDLNALKTDFEYGSKVTLHFDTECHRKMYFLDK